MQTHCWVARSSSPHQNAFSMGLHDSYKSIQRDANTFTPTNHTLIPSPCATIPSLTIPYNLYNQTTVVSVLLFFSAHIFLMINSTSRLSTKAWAHLSWGKTAQYWEWKNSCRTLPRNTPHHGWLPHTLDSSSPALTYSASITRFIFHPLRPMLTPEELYTHDSGGGG